MRHETRGRRCFMGTLNQVTLRYAVFTTAFLWSIESNAAVSGGVGIGSRLDSLNKEFNVAGAFLVGLFALAGLGLMGIGGMGLYKFFKTEGGGQGQSIKGPLAAFLIGTILLGLSVFKGLLTVSVLGKSTLGAAGSGFFGAPAAGQLRGW